MNYFILLLIAALLSLPNVSSAGPVSDDSAKLNSDKFNLSGKLQLSTAATEIDDNDYIRYHAHFRLGLEVKFTDNLALGSRLDAHKYWKDFNDNYTDVIRTERAYLNWSNIADSNLSLSLGRRPFFTGPFTENTDDSKPVVSLYETPIDLNVDGAAVNYDLSSATGVTGMNVQLSYGEGIETEWGNDSRLKDGISSNLADAELAGFGFSLLNDGKTIIRANLFRATDVNDGASGYYAFPTQLTTLFAPTIWQDVQAFPALNFVTRSISPTDIGNINQTGISISHTFPSGLSLFGSITITQLESNGRTGLFGGLGTDAIFVPVLETDEFGNPTGEIYFVADRVEDDSDKKGYGLYAGLQIPAALGKLGLEYNYGSKFWTPFFLAHDDLLGNKLTARGHVGEIYYLFNLHTHASIKVGGIYYDFEYTGSGSPVGEPKKIADVKRGSEYSLLPVIDTAWNTYARIILHF